MSSQDQQTEGTSIFNAMFKVAVGVGGAIFFVLILLRYAWQSPDGVNALQIGLSILFVIFSGFLSMVWGDKFLEALGKLLNSSDGL
jgi:predicted MFS family arabinose efflux permease